MKQRKTLMRSLRASLLPAVGAFVAVAALTGCNGRSVPVAPVVPPFGYIYTDYKAPLQYAANSTEAPDAGVKVAGLKTGQSSASYLYIPLFGGLSFGWDDAALNRAAANGGITKVKYVDYDTFSVLTLYTKTTVVAHGE